MALSFRCWSRLGSIHSSCHSPPGCPVTTTPSTAYQNLFQTFGLRENPFRVASDPRFLFLGRAYEATLSELMHGVESHSGLMVLTGDPGTGKTMLLRHFLQCLNQKKFSNSYIFHSSLNAAGIFEFIALDFGLRVESHRKQDLLAMLERWLQVRQAEGDSPVVVIDEAQALSVRALSELCLLLNLENAGGKLLQLLLAGQPELDDKLRQPELRQLRRRISVRCRLPLLSLEETCEYIGARLRGAGGSNMQVFPAESLEALYSFAQGVPRVTNLLCEKALIAAYAEKSVVVSPGNVRQAAAECEFACEPRATAVPEISLQCSAEIPLHTEETPPDVQTPPVVQDEPRTVVESVVDLPSVPVEVRPKPSVTVLTPKPATQEPAPPDPVAVEHPVVTKKVRQPKRENSFRRYWREVERSFIQDWRHFLGAFQTRAAPDGKVLFMKKYDFRRDLVAPVSRWLNKPVTLKGMRGSGDGRRAGRGSF